VVRWDLFHLDGRRILRGSKAATLRPMTSARQATLDLGPALARFGRENLYLRVALDIGGRRVSQDTAFLTLPRFMTFPVAPVRVTARILGAGRAALTFASGTFQHMVSFDVGGQESSASDNFFDLYPGEPHRVEVALKGRMTAARLRQSVTMRSISGSMA
jgi:beta-mannosidase